MTTLTYYMTEYDPEIFSEDQDEKLSLLANEIAMFCEDETIEQVNVDLAWINLFDPTKYKYDEIDIYHSVFLKPRVLTGFVKKILASFEESEFITKLHFINVSNTIEEDIVTALGDSERIETLD